MGTSFTILRRDLLRLLTNPVALAIALGICVVPCLYAWLNIFANWDPYASTSTVPVIVVNEDVPQEVQDLGATCVGDMMVEKLAENDKLGWRFESRDQALEEVRTGDAYAAIVIPQDFTQTLTGILDGKTDKAHLTYYVNEKVNAVAPKVTDAGASTIETTIDEQFVAVVGRTIAEKLGALANSTIADSHDAADDMISATGNVQDALLEIDGRLSALEDRLTQVKSTLQDATARLGGLEGQGESIATSISDVLDDFSKTRSDTSRLLDDLNRNLTSAGGAVSSISTRTTTDVVDLSCDLMVASTQLDDTVRALEDDLTDSQALTSGLTSTHELIVSFTPTLIDAEEKKFDIERDFGTDLDLMYQMTDEQQAKVEELRGMATRMKTTSAEVIAIADDLAAKADLASDTLLSARTSSVATSIEQAGSALDTFVSVAGRLEAAARLVDPAIHDTIELSSRTTDTLGATQTALSGTRDTLSEILVDLDTLTSELTAISASEAWSRVTELAKTDSEAVHDFLTAPVEVDEVRLYPIDNYGSGVAPFFTNVALWVGGIALVAIFKLEVDKDGLGRLRPWQTYIGRWLLFVLLGALQAIICCTGDLALGIQCTYPWAFFLAALVASFAFVSVIFSLSVAFKHLGKAIAFTLIILQVPGSSGMYPIEMMPPFFQAVAPWLPFTYANNAMREAIGGFYGHNLAYNLVMLLAFVLPSILIGISCRSHLVNVNSLFDRRLRETDHLMVSESVIDDRHRFRLSTIVKARYAPDEYRRAFELRSNAFERAYPSMRRRGIAILLCVPLALFVLSLTLQDKLPVIAALVVSLILIYSHLILLEYFHDHITHKRDLTTYTDAELAETMEDALREELLAYAPIDALIEMRAEQAEHKYPHDRIRERLQDMRRPKESADAQMPQDEDEKPAETPAPETGDEKTGEAQVPEEDADMGGEAK